MDSIRIRISPWRLLYRRTKRMLIDSSISSDVLRAMFNCVRSTITELPNSTNSSSEIPVNTELFGPVMEGVNVLSGFVETVATVVKKGVPLVKDTAENVADIAKCVTLVSSAFQVVVLCASSLAEMGLETIRGYEEWPRLLSQVEELRFAESLSGNPLMNNDRKNLSVILASLKKTLVAFTGRWLLCVDNADSSDVNAALGEVCSLVKECTSEGWVLVTSRQGGKTLWRGMMSAQKLKLEPLGVEQTMKALLRWEEGLLEVEVSDAEMMKKLELLKRDDPLEYEWLLKLSANDKIYGLGGLPLAIAQAGCFIHRHYFSFSKYVSLYGEMRHCKEVLCLFPEVDDRGLEEKNQRMIWATWKANLDQLSKMHGKYSLRLLCLTTYRYLRN